MEGKNGADRGILCSSRLQVVFLLFSLFIVTMLILAGNASSAQLKLAWDASADAGTSGYKIYYGTESGTYQFTIDVGNVTSYTIGNLNAGTIYYLAATAYDTDGNESDFSEELAVNTPSDAVTPVTPVDSDSDGISDNDEINIYGTNPYASDSDGDGMSDGDELSYWGSNWSSDDDGDGIINLLDLTPYPRVVNKRVDILPILTLLLN